MVKIVIDDAIPYVKGVLEPFCEVAYIDGRAIGPRDVRDADALMVRTRTRCDAALLAGSRVRVIATATIGYDHIDTEFCRRAGIRISTAAGCNARGVLQWFGAALAYASAIQEWRPGERTLGVVGAGNVGSLSAVYGGLWGFRVLCCDPPRRRAGLPVPAGEGYVPLAEIARRCDIITFHTPLTLDGPDATFHLAGEEFFGMVRPGTLILNASRGEVVDTRALVGAVTADRCSAVVDTWEHEPDIDPALLRCALLATPHIAGYTAQGKANATAMSVTALSRFFGFPLDDWYPYTEVQKTVPRAIGWDEMRETVPAYFDIAAESARLKARPEDFESLRTSYRYRQEYF
ncbi:MAG: 4-phosphoerythronate dehydrogenase [Rikenellaceae bacterium]|nr:4-phosphoerythronate dehydrogenase [Rikenellaceae bacterium]